MVTGVTQGFARELEIQGVGYRAEASGKKLKLALGFSHPIEMPIPQGSRSRSSDNKITHRGHRPAAASASSPPNVRALRPPEPYKGKGIRYVGRARPAQGRQGRRGVRGEA